LVKLDGSWEELCIFHKIVESFAADASLFCLGVEIY